MNKLKLALKAAVVGYKVKKVTGSASAKVRGAVVSAGKALKVKGR